MQLTRDNLLITLPSVGLKYYVSFELLVTKHTPGDWRNVIHLTTGGNKGVYGYRVPGIWLSSDHKLHITSAVNGVDNFIYNYGKPVEENEWTRLEIQQIFIGSKVDFLHDFENHFKLSFQYYYQITINGSLVKVWINNNPQPFTNVMVYAADPWYQPVNGKIRHLVLSDKKGENL